MPRVNAASSVLDYVLIYFNINISSFFTRMYFKQFFNSLYISRLNSKATYLPTLPCPKIFIFVQFLSKERAVPAYGMSFARPFSLKRKLLRNGHRRALLCADYPLNSDDSLVDFQC